MVLLTSVGVGDPQVLPELVEQAEGPIEQASGDYHRRSLAEAAMVRIKALFASILDARLSPSQIAEARADCAALNRMTRIGMPESHAVAQENLSWSNSAFTNLCNKAMELMLFSNAT